MQEIPNSKVTRYILTNNIDLDPDKEHLEWYVTQWVDFVFSTANVQLRVIRLDSPGSQCVFPFAQDPVASPVDAVPSSPFHNVLQNCCWSVSATYETLTS